VARLVVLLAAGTSAAGAEPVRLEVSQAISGTDQRSGQAVVNFILTTAGREVFARFTAENVGRRIDIRIDGKTMLRPVVREPVNGGVGQIPVATIDEGRVLARRLGSEGARLEVEAAD
jgi:preprotein translocase subunit SecD